LYYETAVGRGEIFFHQKEFKGQIFILLGGRVAEEIANCNFSSSFLGKTSFSQHVFLELHAP
jgi:hypothetical protein